MSKKRGFKNRLRLFHAGNVSCPICLKEFTKEDVEIGENVTLEHVPPKALGGQVRCLTCADCNASAGRTVDQAAAKLERAIQDTKSGRGEKVELDIFGTKHTTFLTPKGITKTQLHPQLLGNSRAHSFLEEMERKGQKTILIAEITRGPNWDVSKGITLTSKLPTVQQVAVSQLRSAFLLVFCLLGTAGYRFATSGALEPIRKQIMHPEREQIPSLLYNIGETRLPKVAILANTWQQPFCWFVKVGEFGIVLPHGGSADHYSEVQALPEQMKPKISAGWYPTKFGVSMAFDMTLREDSPHAGQDLFGREMTISREGFERKIMVVNQDGLVGTFLPSSKVTKATAASGQQA